MYHDLVFSPRVDPGPFILETHRPVEGQLLRRRSNIHEKITQAFKLERITWPGVLQARLDLAIR